MHIIDVKPVKNLTHDDFNKLIRFEFHDKLADYVFVGNLTSICRAATVEEMYHVGIDFKIDVRLYSTHRIEFLVE